MLGVLALVLQVSITAPAAPSPAVRAPGPCDRARAAAAASRHTFHTLVDVAMRWVHGGRVAADSTCVPARPAAVPAPLRRSVALALVRMPGPCDDDDDQDSGKDSPYTLPDWAPPYSSLWIPEPEVQLAAFRMGPECDDSIEAALSGGAELAMAPHPLNGLLGL